MVKMTLSEGPICSKKFDFLREFAKKFTRARGQFLKFPEGSGKFSKISRGRVAPEGNFWKFSAARGKFQKLTEGEGKFRQIPEKNQNFCQIQNYKLSFVTSVDKLSGVSTVLSDKTAVNIELLHRNYIFLSKLYFL